MKGDKEQIDGIDIFYRKSSGHPDIVYTHGFGSNHTYFGHQLNYFDDKGCGTLAWDIPGFGRSGKPLEKDAYSKKGYVKKLEGLVEKCCDGRIIMVGHSMGTLISQEYVAANPEKVDALVLIAGTSNVKESMKEHPLMKYADGYDGWVRSVLQIWNSPLFILNHFRRSTYQDFSSDRFKDMSDWQFLAELYMGMDMRDLEASCIVSEELMCWDSSEAAGKIDAPTLIIHGTADQFLPANSAHSLHELIPGSLDPVIIPGADHALAFREPERINAEIYVFLRTLGLLD